MEFNEKCTESQKYHGAIFPFFVPFFQMTSNSSETIQVTPHQFSYDQRKTGHGFLYEKH